MDNLETPVADNPTTQDVPETAAPFSAESSWHSNLRTDLRDSPLVKKFEDTPDGLNKAMESYGNLEKLLGHDKVPIPKGDTDVDGWNRFSKAMGIPDKAEGYGLSEYSLPPEMKGFGIDKGKFAEIAHAHKFTPAQAKGIWETYNRMNVESYAKAVEDHQKNLVETVNRLKGDWGDAYNVNVELGQTVINKFSDDQETSDFITNTLAQDPRGIKFLAKIGNQFAENKIGEFAMHKGLETPDDIQEIINKKVNDLNGPYMNQGNKFTAKEHAAEVDYVNNLRASIARARG